MKEKDEFWQDLTEEEIIISSDDNALDNYLKPVLTICMMPLIVDKKELTLCIMQFKSLIGVLFGKRYYLFDNSFCSYYSF